MNLASFALVVNFVKYEIFYPILSIAGSSEGHDYLIFVRSIADISRGESEWIVDMSDILQFNALCIFAVPLF